MPPMPINIRSFLLFSAFLHAFGLAVFSFATIFLLCFFITETLKVIDFFQEIYYNNDMKIIKIDLTKELPQEKDFIFSEKPVQGARLGKSGKNLYICSPRRYKLYTDTSDTVCFLNGSGHFKWARGEMNFTAGDTFLVQECGEYEINGACTFIVLRN